MSGQGLSGVGDSIQQGFNTIAGAIQANDVANQTNARAKYSRDVAESRSAWADQQAKLADVLWRDDPANGGTGALAEALAPGSDPLVAQTALQGRYGIDPAIAKGADFKTFHASRMSQAVQPKEQGIFDRAGSAIKEWMDGPTQPNEAPGPEAVQSVPVSAPSSPQPKYDELTAMLAGIPGSPKGFTIPSTPVPKNQNVGTNPAPAATQPGSRSQSSLESMLAVPDYSSNVLGSQRAREQGRLSALAQSGASKEEIDAQEKVVEPLPPFWPLTRNLRRVS